MSKKKDLASDDLVRRYYSPRPNDVDGLNSISNVYYTERLIRLLFGTYDISGMPETWDRNYVYERLFLDGKLCITDTALGVLPLKCGVTGINVFDHPTTCIIANVVLGNLERTIGEDCALVHLQYNYGNVWTILRRYSTLLSMADCSLAVNLITSPTTHIFGAENKAEAESFKRMFDDMTQGKPGVFINSKLAQRLQDSFVVNKAKENFIGEEIENVKQRIINNYLTEIGVTNANTEKRERLVNAEIESNEQEVACSAQNWLETVQEGFDMANSLYGLNLRITRREESYNESAEPDRQPETGRNRDAG